MHLLRSERRMWWFNFFFYNYPSCPPCDEIIWCYKGTKVLNDIPSFRRFNLFCGVHELNGLSKTMASCRLPWQRKYIQPTTSERCEDKLLCYFSSEEVCRASWKGFFYNELWCSKWPTNIPLGITPLTSCPLSVAHSHWSCCPSTKSVMT